MFFFQFMSDVTMVAPTVHFANLLSQHNVTPIYFYRFNFRSVFTRPTWWGCYHGLELDLVFGSPFTQYNIAIDNFTLHTQFDKALSRTVMELWTNFAKTGYVSKLQTVWKNSH